MNPVKEEEEEEKEEEEEEVVLEVEVKLIYICTALIPSDDNTSLTAPLLLPSLQCRLSFNSCSLHTPAAHHRWSLQSCAMLTRPALCPGSFQLKY